MSQFRQWLWLAIVLTGLLLLLVPGSSSDKDESTEPATRKVRTTTVRQQPAVHRAKFPGVVRARNRASLTFTVSGRLQSRLVKEGDKVQKGDMLASIDQKPYLLARDGAIANIKEVEAQLRQATHGRNRGDRLLKAKAITKEEWERIQARWESLEAGLIVARSALAESERQLEETILRAPFDGDIVATALEPGEFARPGLGVLSISGTGGLEMEIQVPESMIGHLPKDQDVTVVFPLLNQWELGAKIQKIGNASTGTGLFPIIVIFDHDVNLRAGLTAIAHLEIEDASAIAVPVASIINPGGTRPLVYKVEDGRIRRIIVSIHDLRDGWVSVRGSLSPGDEVVIAGHAGLIEADKVEALQ